MKKLINKAIVFIGIFTTVTPALATTYVDVKLQEVIEKQSSNRTCDFEKVAEYLLRGANVNEPKPGSEQTPIMQTISLMTTDASSYSKTHEKYILALKRGSLFIPGLAVACAMVAERNKLDNAPARGQYNAITNFRNWAVLTASVTTLLYGLANSVKTVIPAVAMHRAEQNMKAKFLIFEKLLKHPAIDLSLKDKDGKTVFDLFEEYKVEVSRLEKVSFYSPGMVKRAQIMEKLLEQRRLVLEAEASGY